MPVAEAAGGRGMSTSTRLHYLTEEELADIRARAERGRPPARMTTMQLVDNLRQARRELGAAEAEAERLRGMLPGAEG